MGNAMLAQVDEDGSGEVDFAEFLQFMLMMVKGSAADDGNHPPQHTVPPAGDDEEKQELSQDAQPDVACADGADLPGNNAGAPGATGDARDDNNGATFAAESMHTNSDTSAWPQGGDM